jgi:hypothetical protein
MYTLALFNITTQMLLSGDSLYIGTTRPRKIGLGTYIYAFIGADVMILKIFLPQIWRFLLKIGLGNIFVITLETLFFTPKIGENRRK